MLAARREKSLREVANMCLELGSPDSITVNADVSNVNDCKRIVDTTITNFGRGKLHLQVCISVTHTELASGKDICGS